MNLVIAAGYKHEPFLPAWPGQDLFKGTWMHSSQYKNGEPFRENKVLVVGFGNSGGEIAIDLWEHGTQVSLAVRSAVNVIPRELFGIPILSSGYYVAPTGMLREIGLEAKRISASIAVRAIPVSIKADK